MKYIISASLLLLLTCSFMMGCVTRVGDDREVIQRNEISLKAGLNRVGNSSSKADGTIVYTASVVGWEVLESTADYSYDPKWYSTSDIVSLSDATKITLNPVQYYNENTLVKTHIKAWHPRGGTVVGGAVSFAPEHNSKDGLVDVLFADEIWATCLISPSSALRFRHMLTQLKFEVVADENYAAMNNRITSIVIKNAELPLGLDVVNNAVSYDVAGELSVPNIDGQNGILIGTTASGVGSAVMVRPFAGNSFKVDIVTHQKVYTNVDITINDDPQFLAAKSYKVTLDFTGGHIFVGSSIEDWIEVEKIEDVVHPTSSVKNPHLGYLDRDIYFKQHKIINQTKHETQQEILTKIKKY